MCCIISLWYSLIAAALGSISGSPIARALPPNGRFHLAPPTSVADRRRSRPRPPRPRDRCAPLASTRDDAIAREGCSLTRPRRSGAAWVVRRRGADVIDLARRTGTAQRCPQSAPAPRAHTRVLRVGSTPKDQKNNATRLLNRSAALLRALRTHRTTTSEHHGALTCLRNDIPRARASRERASPPPRRARPRKRARRAIRVTDRPNNDA